MNSNNIIFLRKASFFSSAVTYLWIFLGGLVRVSGAGQSCPGWPKCYGLWLPPSSISEIPAGIDVAGFDPQLTWIVFIYKYIGLFVLLSVGFTIAVAFQSFKYVSKIFFALLSVILIILLDLWLSLSLFSVNYEPFAITVHYILSLIIASILVYVTTQAYLIENPQSEEKAEYPASSQILFSFLWAFGIIQIALGTRVREQLEWVSGQLPLLGRQEWLSEIGSIGYLHGLTGVIQCIVTWAIGYWLLKNSKKASALVTNFMNGVMGLMLAQILLGVALFMAGLPAVVQILHEWGSSLYIGLILALYSTFVYKNSLKTEAALNNE